MLQVYKHKTQKFVYFVLSIRVLKINWNLVLLTVSDCFKMEIQQNTTNHSTLNVICIYVFVRPPLVVRIQTYYLLSKSWKHLIFIWFMLSPKQLRIFMRCIEVGNETIRLTVEPKGIWYRFIIMYTQKYWIEKKQSERKHANQTRSDSFNIKPKFDHQIWKHILVE